MEKFSEREEDESESERDWSGGARPPGFDSWGFGVDQRGQCKWWKSAQFGFQGFGAAGEVDDSLCLKTSTATLMLKHETTAHPKLSNINTFGPEPKASKHMH